MTTYDAPAAPAGAREIAPFHYAKLAFLAAGFVSFLLSVILWFGVDREMGLFVGLWVPAIHSLGTLVLTGERRR